MSGSRRNAGALAPFVDGYGAWLAQQGYSSAAVTHSLTTLGHLGRWMDGQDVAVNQLAEEPVVEFAARIATFMVICPRRAPVRCWRFCAPGEWRHPHRLRRCRLSSRCCLSIGGG